MATLCSRLEQHRRWHSLAEVKIHNVERARRDADRRNAALQREMEQFFKTFGEGRGGRTHLQTLMVGLCVSRAAHDALSAGCLHRVS